MEDHKRQSPAPSSIRVYVLTVSDSRTEETDVGGRKARELCTRAGHTVAGSRIVKDEPEVVASVVR